MRRYHGSLVTAGALFILFSVLGAILPNFSYADVQEPLRAVNKDGVLYFGGAELRVRYDLNTGTFDVFDSSGATLIKNARSEVTYISGGVKSVAIMKGGLVLTQETLADKSSEWYGIDISTPLSDKTPAIFQTFLYDRNSPFLLIDVGVGNYTHEPISVERISPVIVDGGNGGGIFLSETPENVRILENGYKNQLDFWVRLVTAKAGSESNWNSALCDLKSHRTLVGGFVTQNNSLGSIVVSHEAALSLNDKQTGRKSISGYLSRATFSPLRRVDIGESIMSDYFAFVYDDKDPLNALKTFSDMSSDSANNGNKRNKPVSFWDTWYSRYVEDVSEDVVMKNLDAVAEKLAPYGMNTFEIDAGWEKKRGDWFYNETKFPHGLKFISDKIREKGLRPAVWIAPFMATTDTPVYHDHPDWFLKELDTYGKALIPKETRAIDISNPEAQKWIADVVKRITHDYGIGMLKVDFTYYSLAGKKYFETGRTRAEIFREAYKIIRDAAGPDVYILAVGVPLGYHAGLVDAMRTGLDNAPRWGAESGYAVQGTLPSYRAMIRRYYLNRNVWIDDPDCVYTGLESSFKRWNQPVQPRNELLAWVSAVGLSGQMIELADTPTDLGPDNLKLIRSILPVYNASARPLDLFEKENPEILDLNVDKTFGGWHVVGLFNWGQNSGPEGEFPAGPREISVPYTDLGMDAGAECHVYDFWNDKYVGKFKGSFSAKIDPRSVSVFAIRPALNVPQFLATNRHITMGATDIESITWQEADNTLSGTQQAVAGFDYHLAFYVPDNFRFKSVTLSSGNATTDISDGGRVLNIRFTPEKSAKITWDIKFDKM